MCGIQFELTNRRYLSCKWPPYRNGLNAFGWANVPDCGRWASRHRGCALIVNPDRWHIDTLQSMPYWRTSICDFWESAESLGDIPSSIRYSCLFNVGVIEDCSWGEELLLQTLCCWAMLKTSRLLPSEGEKPGDEEGLRSQLTTEGRGLAASLWSFGEVSILQIFRTVRRRPTDKRQRLICLRRLLEQR